MSRAATQGRSSISAVVAMVALASSTVSAFGSDLGCLGVRTTLSASVASTPSRSRKRKKLLMADSARASEREVRLSARRAAM